MRDFKFTVHDPKDTLHRRHFIGAQDTAIVLSRLPSDVLGRLKGVHFSDRARGNRRLGYVNRGRREICICALPPHLSLTQALLGSQTPEIFGALRGCQWPFLAIRRFMLYDTLLHELGHLQVVHENEREVRRKFAMEPLAQEFADTWRESLWSRHFESPDLAHNPPSSSELDATRAHWPQAHALYRLGQAQFKKRNFDEDYKLLKESVDLYPYHSMALEKIGICYLYGTGPELSIVRAKEYFAAALKLDPYIPMAYIYMSPRAGK